MTILYTLSFHLRDSELWRQNLVKAFMAAVPLAIRSVMFRLGLPSSEMIIPRYLALSTTVTTDRCGGDPRVAVKVDVLRAVYPNQFTFPPA